MNVPHHPDVSVDYDRDADVLYVSQGDPVPATSDEDEHGLVLRFALTGGRLCGVTVLGFKHQWGDRKGALAEVVGGHLHVPMSELQTAIQSATRA
jgi:hypothetical protein